MAKNALGNSIDIVGAFRPVDMQTGANNGDWVSLENAAGVLVVFHSGVGTAGDDPILNINQAQDTSGTGTKDLPIPTTGPSRVWKKQAATNLLAVGTWTDAKGDISSGNWTHDESAEQEALVVVDVKAEDLDVDNGFRAIQATVADVGGNAQLGTAYYILYGLAYSGRPDHLNSPL